jgi:hypothetical protein
MRPEFTPLFLARYWARVDKSGDCWLWTGGKTVAGYGILYQGGRGSRRIYAHRVAWELANGPIPDGLLVCHACDTPPCVNPAHLWLGTDSDNAWDKSRKGRSTTGDKHGLRLHPERVPRGERSGAAKLTEVDVRTIRIRYAGGGVTQQRLADEYGVVNSLICLIIKRRLWAHVE